MFANCYRCGERKMTDRKPLATETDFDCRPITVYLYVSVSKSVHQKPMYKTRENNKADRIRTIIARCSSNIHGQMADEYIFNPQ